MKTSSALKVTFISNLIIFLLLISTIGYACKIFFDYKDLSDKSYKVLMSWDKIDRMSNDILLRTFSIYGNMELTVTLIERNWNNEIDNFEKSLIELLNYSKLDSFIHENKTNKEQLYSLWIDTNEKLTDARYYFKKIIDMDLGKRLTANNFLKTFYQMCRLNTIGSDEIVLVLKFVSNISILDTNGDKLNELLVNMNDDIQSTINKKSIQIIYATIIICVILILISFVFMGAIKKVNLVEKQKKTIDRSRKLRFLKDVLLGKENINIEENESFCIALFSLNSNKIIGQAKIIEIENYIDSYFKDNDITSESVMIFNNNIYSFIYLDENSIKKISEDKIFNRIINNIDEKFDIQFHVAISDIESKESIISEVHKKIIEKNNFYFLLENATVIRNIPPIVPISDSIYPHKIEKHILEAINSNNKENFKKQLNDLHTLIKEYHYLNARSILMKITTLITWNFGEIIQNYNVTEHKQMIDLLPEINTCKRISESLKLIEGAGEEIIDCMINFKENKNENIINKIDDLIKTEYSNINLSSMYIADRIQLSVAYTNRIYRKFKNISINTKINDVRLEKSLLLLKIKNKKISQVAEEVGFTNYGYYFTLFKKKYGITPKDYQNK